jgi:hypothetical protein
MQRNGKIARLPREIRDELNTRLAEGEPGGPLPEWLNGLPAVKAVLDRHFGGQTISKRTPSRSQTRINPVSNRGQTRVMLASHRSQTRSNQSQTQSNQSNHF